MLYVFLGKNGRLQFIKGPPAIRQSIAKVEKRNQHPSPRISPKNRLHNSLTQGKPGSPSKIRVVKSSTNLQAKFSKPKLLQGSREPSGAVAIPEKGGIFVVDDEPKRGNSQGLFFYRVKGKTLQNLPFRIVPNQKRKWNDWEGATRDKTHIYLMTSHDKKKSKRSKICRFPIKKLTISSKEALLRGYLECSGGKKQRKRIIKLLKKAAYSIGFTLPRAFKKRHPKNGGLNFEAFHYNSQKDVFYIGLRSPLASLKGNKYAIVLSMKWYGGYPGFSFAGLLYLKDKGIRAMEGGAKGSIQVIAGPAGVSGSFALANIPGFPKSPFLLGLPKAFRKVQPSPKRRFEAMVQYKGTWFLFSDDGNWDEQTPAHYSILR